jgi:internalin A
MYLSVDEKHFVHHFDLEALDEAQDKIPVYREKEITTTTNEKIKMIDQTTSKAIPVYPFKNFSNNRKLKAMKKIFISYSRKDVYYKDKLRDYLNFLKIFEIADNWCCEDINIEKWNPKIQKELEESDLIIYMLSVNFFLSPYIREKEILTGMEQIENNPNKKAFCIVVSDFPRLNALEDSIDFLSPAVKASLKLLEWQYAPYGREKIGEGSGKPHSEEKIIPLDRYENNDRSLNEALTEIANKIQKLFNP